MAFNNGQAAFEGWDLFEVGGTLQLQHDDEAGMFETDEAALKYVTEQAAAGSTYHAEALSLIGTAAP